MSRILWLLQRVAYLPRLAVFDLLRIGKRAGFVSIGPGIRFAAGMKLRFGKRVHLAGGGAFIGPGRVEIGDRTYVGHYFTINAQSSISIGKNCMLANFVSLVDNAHGTQRDRPMGHQPISSRPIVIGENCWIAEKATVLAGVSIGEGSIVAAGAVVNHDVPPHTLVGGIPARIIRKLT